MDELIGWWATAVFGISVIVFAVCMFLSLSYDHQVQLECDRAVEEFVDQSRANGYISYNNYLELADRLSATGYIYTIFIENDSKITVSSDSDLGYEDTYYASYEDEILEYMFNGPEDVNNGYRNYSMKAGDYLKVSYSINCRSFSSMIIGLITVHQSYKTIYGSSSGLVGANA